METFWKNSAVCAIGPPLKQHLTIFLSRSHLHLVREQLLFDTEGDVCFLKVTFDKTRRKVAEHLA